MTLAVEIMGWFLVVAGLPLIRQGGLAIGAAGAVLLGMAYSGVLSL